MTIAEMAEAAKVPHIAIVRAMAEYGFDKLRHLHKALVLEREFRLEKLRTEAMERLHQMATNLSAEYPDGLKPDQARMLDVERRAIGSLLRLPPFPSLRDFWAGMRPPTAASRARHDDSSRAAHASASTERDFSGGDDDNGGAWSLYNQSLQKRLRKHLEEREARARAEAAKSPNETGATGSPRTQQPVGEELTACPAGEAVAPDSGEAVAPGLDIAATPAVGDAVEESEAPGREFAGRNGNGLPMGLNRAARRKWLREQRRLQKHAAGHNHNGRAQHPP
jgi:hypothetical protein